MLMPKRGKPWQPAENEKIISLWPTRSASQIASEMQDRSRSAVMGRIARLRAMGLLEGAGSRKMFDVRPWKIRDPSARPKRVRRKPAKTDTMTEDGPPPAQVRLEDVLAGDLPPLVANPCSILELDDTRCHWPLGEVHEISTEYCGGAALAGQSYCAHHAYLASPRSKPS